MPGIGQPPDPPTSGIGAPLFKPPGSSNIGLPTDPRFVWTSVGGYVPRTTRGPSPRPLTLGEALQQQQRERENAAWAAMQARKRQLQQEAQRAYEKARKLEEERARRKQELDQIRAKHEEQKKLHTAMFCLLLFELAEIGRLARQLEEKNSNSSQ